MGQKGNNFVKIFPQYFDKISKPKHAKFLFGQKGGGIDVYKKVFNQYSQKYKNREGAEKYFLFNNDGFMTSAPFI